MMLFGGVFWVVLLALIVAAVVWFGRHNGHPGRTGRSAALDILEGRYAHGEIERDEYLQKKRDLSGS